MARSVRIKGPGDLAKLSRRSQEAFLGAAEAKTEARRRGTPVAVEVKRLRAQGVRTSMYSVKRYFGHDLERGRGGRLYANDADRSYHGDMTILSTEGKVTRPVRGSRKRSLVAAHGNAVRRYLNGLDPEGEGLDPFRGVRVAGVELETDLGELEALQNRGELDGFDLYPERGL